jgi:hypothetical protein
MKKLKKNKPLQRPVAKKKLGDYSCINFDAKHAVRGKDCHRNDCSGINEVENNSISSSGKFFSK